MIAVFEKEQTGLEVANVEHGVGRGVEDVREMDH